MADFFVNSNATGLNDGSNWVNAFTTFTSGVSALVSTDRIILADVHSESIGASTTYTFPGSNIVITSTVTGVSTITSTRAAVFQIKITLGNLSINGPVLFFGSYLVAEDNIRLNNARMIENSLDIGDPSGSAASITGIGTADSFELIYCDINVISTLTATSIIMISNRQSARIIGGTISSNRITLTDNHVAFQLTSTSSIKAEGIDLSGFQQKFLTRFPNGLFNGICNLTRMRINTVTTDLILGYTPSYGEFVVIDAVDDANTVNRQFKENFEGSFVSETSIVLDATNPDGVMVSNKIVTNTKAEEFFSPLRFSIINGWADFATAKTIVVEFVQDGTTTALTDAEIWIEIQYPDDTTSIYHVEDDRAINNQTTANQTSSSASWTGLSGTNVKQKCSVTTTNTGKQGPYQVFLCLAKTSTTVYVNPKSDIS